MWRLKGHLWRLPFPKSIAKTPFYEGVITFLILFAHLYRLNFWISACYFISGNICYCLSIIPDHDTYET